jgi:hypothetical protein
MKDHESVTLDKGIIKEMRYKILTSIQEKDYPSYIFWIAQYEKYIACGNVLYNTDNMDDLLGDEDADK